MLNEALLARDLPQIWPDMPANPEPMAWEERRQAILKLLAREMFGVSPPPPQSVDARIVEDNQQAYAGKASQQKIELSMDLPGGRFSFPVNLIRPKSNHKLPLFVHIAFRPDIPHLFLPAEEIVDHGFALLNIWYEDIAPDCEDQFTSGLPAFFPDWLQRPDRWGKIAMWAWAASRAMDYVMTCPDIDPDRVAVSGHSRLGKTALWAGANDQRFKLVISNDSGCSGAALARGGSGESVRAITERFPYWFTEAYKKYADAESMMPFDQHFLLAAAAPRKLYVASAAGDSWADPDSEFLSAWITGKLYQKLGLPGLICADAWPADDIILQQGNIAYHRRPGLHYVTRTDWQRFMAFL